MALVDKTPVKHGVISVLVENQPGVLARVVGLFSARGFNIDSLAVGETHDPTISRITLVVTGDERTIEQIKKQLHKLIDVIKIQDLTTEDFFDRELMLVKLKNSPELKKKMADIVKQYHVVIAAEDPKFILLSCVESRENTKKLFESFKEIGILEIARTGTVALSKKAPKK